MNKDGPNPADMIRAGMEISIDAGRQPTARTADVIAEEINRLKEDTRKTVAANMVKIGADLLEAKRLVPRGEWEEWLEDRVAYSVRTAQQLMQVAKEFSYEELAALGDISITQAVAIISCTSEERAKLMAEYGDASTRDLQEAVRRLKAEKAAMQVTLDKLTAESEYAAADLMKKNDDLQQSLSEAREDIRKAAADRDRAIDQLKDVDAMAKDAMARAKAEAEEAAIAKKQGEIEQIRAKLIEAESRAKKAENALETLKNAQNRDEVHKNAENVLDEPKKVPGPEEDPEKVRKRQVDQIDKLEVCYRFFYNDFERFLRALKNMDESIKPEHKDKAVEALETMLEWTKEA